MKHFGKLDMVIFPLIIPVIVFAFLGILLLLLSFDHSKDYQIDYEIVAIHKYKVDETNSFGAITGSHFEYDFIYKDSNGNLYEYKNFHVGGDLYQLEVGAKCDTYIVKKFGLDTYHYLILTNDTYVNIVSQ